MMRKCERCGKHNVPEIRYINMCGKCSGELYCQENGHGFMFDAGAALDTAEELTFQCEICGIERVCIVMPKSLLAEFHK